MLQRRELSKYTVRMFCERTTNARRSVFGNVSWNYLLFAPTTARKRTAAKADPTMASDLTTTSVNAVSVGEVISGSMSRKELFWHPL
jgi:hypothetical protein